MYTFKKWDVTILTVSVTLTLCNTITTNIEQELCQMD